MPSKKTKSQSTYKLPSLSSIYRKIAVSFVVLTVILVGIIAFFSVARATITITPKEELKSAEFLIAVKPGSGSADEGSVRGYYEEKIIEEEGQFEATGVSEKQGRAEGMIMVINTTSAPQPLVATTRFLSEGGVLFRTKDGITVPASGKIEVGVYADVPGSPGDIGPSKFTIPGLNPVKQELIYGESAATMSGGAQMVRVVTAEDIERATTEVSMRAEKAVEEELKKSEGAALGGVLVSSERIEASADAKKGDERQTFSTRVKIRAQMLTYERPRLLEAARGKVAANVPPDRELVKFNEDAILVRIKNANPELKEAQLSIYADGEVRISASSQILDPVKIAGMLPEEVRRYLESFDAIEGVEVKLFPSWQKRIPAIPDRIKIVIRK